MQNVPRCRAPKAGRCPRAGVYRDRDAIQGFRAMTRGPSPWTVRWAPFDCRTRRPVVCIRICTCVDTHKRTWTPLRRPESPRDCHSTLSIWDCTLFTPVETADPGRGEEGVVDMPNQPSLRAASALFTPRSDPIARPRHGQDRPSHSILEERRRANADYF